VVGTWLAIRSVDLHFLQTVVVVLPGRNVPLDFGVQLALEVSALLFHLHFENAGVDLDRQIGHLLQGRGAFVPHRDFFPDLVLQSSVELGGQSIVVPTDFGCENRELRAVSGRGYSLSQSPKVSVGFQRVVSDIERFFDRGKEEIHAS
jgi:hypothetical protein